MNIPYSSLVNQEFKTIHLINLKTNVFALANFPNHIRWYNM
jgi:hypothetical protein